MSLKLELSYTEVEVSMTEASRLIYTQYQYAT